MNAYATLNDLKSLLKVKEAENNADLLRTLIAASRQIDKLTGRIFYCLQGKKYYSNVSTRLWLPDDILSVSTLKCDRDGDGVFEVSMAATDYFLYPLSEFPKTLLRINSNGSYSSFASGIEKGVEIDGVFGYADSATPYEEKTAINQAAGITALATSFPVDDGSAIKIGQTIRIELEQMFVEDIAQNTLHVKRAMNGSIAETHADDKVVSVYTYLEDIVQATLIITMRAWKRKDSPYQDIMGTPETGQVITSKGLDPDVVTLITPYMRQEYA